MAVWSMVDGVVKKHADSKPMLAASARIMFATLYGKVASAKCGIYRRDPAKNPDEPNVLPELVAKANRKTKTRKR
jgi:hypothetical protein